MGLRNVVNRYKPPVHVDALTHLPSIGIAKLTQLNYVLRLFFARQ